MPLNRQVAASDPSLFDSAQKSVVKAPPRRSRGQKTNNDSTYFTPLGQQKNKIVFRSCVDISVNKPAANKKPLKLTMKSAKSQEAVNSRSRADTAKNVRAAPLNKESTSSKPETATAPSAGGGLLGLNPVRDRRASMVFVDFLTEDGVTDVTQFLNDYSKKNQGPAPVASESSSSGSEETEETEEEETEETASESEVNESEYEREMARISQNKNTTRPPPKGPNPLFQTSESPTPRLSLAREVPPAAEITGRPASARNVDDVMFDMFRDPESDTLLVGDFLGGLAQSGIRKDDQRLKELFSNLQEEKRFQGQPCESVDSLRLDRDGFRRAVQDNIVLISRALRQQFIIPDFAHFCNEVQNLYMEALNVNHGKVQSNIPQLARVNPEHWGVAICTIDGQRFSIGDTDLPFTLQSCCKPLTYAIALNELGPETVHGYVGQEPSGRMFNELVLDYNNKPHNPMVNAGAIIVCSILKSLVQPEMTLAEKFDYTHQYLKRLCGGEHMGFNNSVFLSEREVADRNYALGFYLRENNCFPDGKMLRDCMDYYFQCCSMETNCEAAAVIAATLADGGVCPVTGEKVLNQESVRDVLSLMHSCGMYDYSGQFAFNVGLPAKSGASGAILLVVPNVLGMCLWSPALDTFGNSARGVFLCEELVKIFNFHKYDNMATPGKIDPRKKMTETRGLQIVKLLMAAANGDIASLKRFHLSGVDMSASDYDGRTALHLAAVEGHKECVEYLLRFCRVNPTPLDRWGNKPRDDAERFKHSAIAKILRRWETAVA